MQAKAKPAWAADEAIPFPYRVERINDRIVIAHQPDQSNGFLPAVVVADMGDGWYGDEREKHATASQIVETVNAYDVLRAAACPNRSLHQVEGAPIQKLADLLRTATEFDEQDSWCATLSAHDAAATDCPCGYVALRAAVRALNGGAS